MVKRSVEVNFKQIDIDTNFLLEIAKKTFNEGKKNIQSQSPHGNGKYRDGWKVKTSKGIVILKNFSKKSFIENFLENGHKVYTVNNKGTKFLRSYQYEYIKKSNTLSKNTNGKLKVNYVNPVKHIDNNIKKTEENLINNLKSALNNGNIVITK